MLFPLMMIGGMALSAISQYKAGQARAQELEMQRYQALYNAQIAEQDAAAMQRKTDFEQMQQLRYSESVMGSMRAAQGASGAQTDVGTPVAVRASQWAELELENFLIGLEGRTEKSKLKQEAAFQRVQAQYYGKAARSARKAGILGGFTTMLGGIGGMGAMGMFGGGGATSTAPASLTTPRGPTGMGY